MTQCKNLFGKGNKFILPCMLLILSDQSYHGYGILNKIKEFGFYESDPDMSVIYRNLGKLEENGLVESQWDTSESGPAKKVYSITDDGICALEERIVFLKKRKKAIEGFIDVYEKKGGN